MIRSNPPVVHRGQHRSAERSDPGSRLIDRLETLWPRHRLGVLRRAGRLHRPETACSPSSRADRSTSVARAVSVFDRDKTPADDLLDGRRRASDQRERLTGSHRLRAPRDRRPADAAHRQPVRRTAPGDPNFGRTTDGGPFISQVGYDGFIDYDGIVVSLRRPFHGRYGFMGLVHLLGRRGQPADRRRRLDLQQQQPAGARSSASRTSSAPHVIVGNVTTLLPWNIRLSAIALLPRRQRFFAAAASSTPTVTAWSISAIFRLHRNSLPRRRLPESST